MKAFSCHALSIAAVTPRCILDESILLFGDRYFYWQQYLECCPLHLATFFSTFLFKKALLNLWSIFQFVDKMEFDAWYSNSVIIMPIGSNIRLVLMRDMLLLFLYSKEALKACLLPKKTHYFLCVHSKTKRVKKQPMGQYQKACPFNETFESNEAITNKKGE